MASHAIVPSPAQVDEAARQVAAAFPGQALVSVDAAGRFVGIARGTTRNQISEGRFPLPTIKRTRLRFVPTAAIAQYLAERLAEAGIEPMARLDMPAVPTQPAPTQIEPQRERIPGQKGRYRNSEKIEAARLGISVAELRRRAAGEASHA